MIKRGITPFWYEITTSICPWLIKYLSKKIAMDRLHRPSPKFYGLGFYNPALAEISSIRSIDPIPLRITHSGRVISGVSYFIQR